LNHGGEIFTILLQIKLYTKGEQNRIDVILAADDEMLRLPTEQVFRSESINSISVSNIENTVYMLNWYFPSIIIVEKAQINMQIYENFKMKFPSVKIVVISEDKNLEGIKDLYQMPLPINYAKLISKIKYLL
jgi:hypothetical protein